MELIAIDKMTIVRFDVFPTDRQVQLLEEWTKKYTTLLNTALAGVKVTEQDYAEMLPDFKSWKLKQRIERDVWLIQNKRMRKFSKPVFRCDTGSYQLVRGKISLALSTKRIWVPTDGTWIALNRQGSLTFWKEAGKWRADILLWVKRELRTALGGEY